MHARSISIAAISLLYLTLPQGGAAQAQMIHASVEDVALRNGESTEFSDAFLVGVDCKSLLTALPEVEVMDAPPGVAVAVKEAMVVPHGHGCDKSVPGDRVVITANGIDVYSYTRMVLRITYKTQTATCNQVSTST